MAGAFEGFQYENGVWRTVWRTPKGINLNLFVIGDAEFMRPHSLPTELQGLLNGIDEQIDRAFAFARASVYGDDISLAGGMDIDGAVVNSWDEVKYWFALRDSDRMVGVKMQQGNPMDVYCDH